MSSAPPPTLPPGRIPPPPPRAKKRHSHPRLRALSYLAVGILLLLLILAVGSCMTVRIPASGSRQTVLFFSVPTDLAPGSRIDRDELENRLRRLGYRASTTLQPGEYRMVSGGAEIHLRPFRYPSRFYPGGIARVWISGGTVRRIETDEALDPDQVALEPERLAGYEGQIGAFLHPLRLKDAPPLLVKAIVAVEDRRFYSHPGIDPIGTARAVWTDLRRGEHAQGGSTITQQLARSLYLHNQKTFGRKLREAVIALGLELRYSKDEILEAYLNAVYWGYWGSMEIRGVREASSYYLGKEVDDLDPAGIALLVGLIRAPNAYSPYSSAEKAKKRRDVVLRLLMQQGILSEAEGKKALAQPVRAKRPPDRPADAAYFLDAARKEVERRAPRGTLEKPGTMIFTTLDPRDQAAVVASLRKGLEDLEKDHRSLRRKKDRLQGAAIVMDPTSGEVRALVGGRDYAASPFNRAIDAQRQPGSLFKPFVYLAAFQNPRRRGGGYWTPATVVKDEPIEIRAGRKMWRPKNYDRQYRGEVTVRQALAQSLNVPTAYVANLVGIRKVAEAAHDLGIESELDEVPSLSLGTSEVTLLEICSAYAALADEGRSHAPTMLRGILDGSGKMVMLDPLDDPPGVGAPEAYLVTRLLEGVIDNGTGRRARSMGIGGDVAGKTGTTDDYRDAWFIGFTPRRLAGVWVGYDRKEVIGLSGSAAALPIWGKVMLAIRPDRGDGEFQRPPGIVTVAIDPESGMLATSDCPGWREEEFLEGTEPQEECDRHGGFFDSIREFFHL